MPVSLRLAHKVNSGKARREDALEHKVNSAASGREGTLGYCLRELTIFALCYFIILF